MRQNGSFRKADVFANRLGSAPSLLSKSTQKMGTLLNWAQVLIFPVIVRCILLLYPAPHTCQLRTAAQLSLFTLQPVLPSVMHLHLFSHLGY